MRTSTLINQDTKHGPSLQNYPQNDDTFYNQDALSCLNIVRNS